MIRNTAKNFLMYSCICVCLLAGCGKNTEKPESTENSQSSLNSQNTQSESIIADSDEPTEEYPMIVNMDQVLYYGTGEECLQVPRKAPDGSIKTFYPPEIMPDMPESANFGKEGEELQYMFLEDGSLIVQINGRWMFFEENSD